MRITQPTTRDDAASALARARQRIDSPTQTLILSAEHQSGALERGFRKPSWIWTAVDDDGSQRGVVAAWGPGDGEHPWLLDLFDLDDLGDDDALALLDRAIADSTPPGGDAPEVDLFLPLAADAPAVDRILVVLGRLGFAEVVRRRKYRATPESAVDASASRLDFAPVAGAEDPDALSTYRAILEGTLDAHSLLALRRGDPESVAREELGDIVELETADHVFLARDRGGDIVGLVSGSVRPGGTRGTTAFIGVVPEHRGRGYAGELLAWITSHQIAAGATELFGETDEGNWPMDRAFRAQGYEPIEGRVDLQRPSSD